MQWSGVRDLDYLRPRRRVFILCVGVWVARGGQTLGREGVVIALWWLPPFGVLGASFWNTELVQGGSSTRVLGRLYSTGWESYVLEMSFFISLEAVILPTPPICGQLGVANRVIIHAASHQPS